MIRSLIRHLAFPLLAVLFFMATLGDDFKLTDGTVYSGKPTSFNEDGTVIKLDSGGFSPRVPWPKVPQETLKELAKDPKVKPFVEPFIDVPVEARKPKKENQITLKPVPRVDYYQKKPAFTTAFTTPIGLLLLAAVLGASIYAGYEVAIYKHHPPAVVCGASAIIPLLGPLIFLFVPPMQSLAHHPAAADYEPEEAAANPADAPSKGKTTRAVGVPSGGGLSVAKTAHKAAGGIPETIVYKKPEITFNRRFFETKFTGFFRIVPSEAEKDLLLVFRCGRTEFVGRRISRITMNDMHIALISGAEQPISFGDITEVQVRHKDVKS